MVSVHKYGFFLCREGSARILLGPSIYRISRNYLCIYTPNTLFQILEKSRELKGVFEEDDVDTYYPVISSIGIRERLRVRTSPCVEVSEVQADEIARLHDMVRESACLSDSQRRLPHACGEITETLHSESLRHLRYVLCLKTLEAYFSNTPAESMPQNKDDAILNRFLVSVYENCHIRRTVRYYADEQHLSPYYFSSIIRERSGKSALQWIATVTMTLARQYLACSELSVKEIADRLNFPDQSTFGRFFRSHEGCTPSAFRKKIDMVSQTNLPAGKDAPKETNRPRDHAADVHFGKTVPKKEPIG